MPFHLRPQSAASIATTGSLNKTRFNVKYVAEDAVYIDGGKDAGLVEGMTLTHQKGRRGCCGADRRLGFKYVRRV